MKQRPKGQRTRAAILAEAARLATVDGLDGLSIGGLATAIGMSKSGLYAHFGSKEDLQLATIASARETFVAEVFVPALDAPQGIRRLYAACDAFLSHIERRVFPGGCFFAVAAADVGTRPGAVRDAVAAQQRDWTELLERLAGKAMDLGELEPGDRPGAARLRAQRGSGVRQFDVHSPGRPGGVRARPCGGPPTGAVGRSAS